MAAGEAPARGEAPTAGEVTAAGEPARLFDPRAVRVSLAPSSAREEIDAIVVESEALVLVDDRPVRVRLDRHDARHGVLVEGSGDDVTRTPVLLVPPEPRVAPAVGVARREVVVDGWRVEVEIESARHAELRERAGRGRERTARGGPTEVRAIIPGRIVALSVAPGDLVVAGQQLMVIEAMKMQNELRAPRDGVVTRVDVGPGRTIELGDLLLVLE